MSSRRVMQRSYSGDGRSALDNGDDVNSGGGGSNWQPVSRGYLSNVRPESSCSRLRYSQYRSARSTLCTVMAQLTEETQPTFEVTLRSRAVSEECKVTFTCEVRGHPIPEVIWYKDDVQLDRFCGLPKYEIFRNGPNHSLRIFNCTMEDAAIYQVSASNTKGIVSCSGVLEVGLMNEYLIHQRYFGKLKQKAESRRRRELEEREDQGAVAEQDPFRNLSPDRAQRKRRSTMAHFPGGHFSAPGSMEEASVTAGEWRHEVPGADAEARLQDSSTAGQTMEKPASVANGTPAASVVNGTSAASVVNGTSAASVVNGHAGVTENGSKGITYVYDTAQKVFTAQQPKTPSLKKIMKISNNVEGVKEDAPVGGVSEKRGSRVRPSEKQAPVEQVKSQGPVGEVMEVESSTPFAPLDSAPPANTELGQKRAAALNVNKTPPKEDKKGLDRAMGRLQGTQIPTKKEKPTPNARPVHVSSAVSLRKQNGVHGEESKQGKPLHQERVGHGDTKKKYLDSRAQVSAAQRPAAQVATTQQPLSSNHKQKDIKRNGVSKVDIAIGPTETEPQTLSAAPQSRTAANVATSSPAVLPHEASDSARPRHQGTTVQRCLSAGDALPRSPGEPGCKKKETSPCLENVSVYEPQQLAETSQAFAPAVLQELSDAHKLEERQQVTQAHHAQPNRSGTPVSLKLTAPRCATDAPSTRGTPSEEQTVVAGGQKPTAHRPIQGTRRTAGDHSRGSSERSSVPFTDPATFLDKGLGYGQSSAGCSVSHAPRLSGVSAVNTEEGLPADTEVTGHQAGSLPVFKRKVEMEADIRGVKETERAHIGVTLEEHSKETLFITSVSHTDVNNEPIFKSSVETHPIMQETNITGVDTSNRQVTMAPGNINVPDTNVSKPQMNPLKKVHKPGANVLSVAEIMRSQIKALDSTMSNPLTVESKPVTVESNRLRVESKPVTVESNTVTIESNPMTVESNPLRVESNPVTVESNRAIVKSKPATVESKTATVESKPVTVESNPLRVESNPVTVESNRAIVKSKPATVESKTATVESNTLRVESNLLRVESNPVTLESNRAIVKSKPETVESKPATVESKPATVESNPLRVESKPATVESNTFAVESNPLRVESKPATVESNTFAVESNPLRVESNPLRVESNPVTLESNRAIVKSKPETVESKPVTVESKPVTVESNPLRVESKPATFESNSVTVESIASTPLFASSTEKEAATEKCSVLREDLEKGCVIESAAMQIEEKIETKPPEEPPKTTSPTTEAMTSFSRRTLGMGLDVERPKVMEQKIEAKSVSIPETLDETVKQFGFQPINPTVCTPEQPQTPTAPTTEAISTFSRGEVIGKGLDVERTIEIEMEPKIDTKSVSTPEFQHTTTECTPDRPVTPTAPNSKAVTSFSIPPISVRDTESITETYSGMENDNIMDTGHECGTSSPVSLVDRPDPPPAVITDENTTITCCSKASLMELDCKVLTDLKSSVVMTQEHLKSLSCEETGIDSAELCTDNSEKGALTLAQHSPKLFHGADEGVKQIPPPEIKLNSESNSKSTPVISPTCVDAQKTPELYISRVETKQENTIQQEKNLSISIIDPMTTASVNPTSSSNNEAPLQELKSDASPTLPSATPKELALGARRKIFTSKSKTSEDNGATTPPIDSQPQSKEVLPKPSKAPLSPTTLSVPPSPAQPSLLATEPSGQRTPPVRRRSPLLSRKAVAQESTATGKEALHQTQQTQIPKSEEKPAEKEKHDPFKAPQVIRKIRGESFSDASGHLKLWCQFFNVLSDSVINWYRDDVEVAQVTRSAGDETPVNLAIVQASKKDCGVYGCKITNDHGTDITDLLLSVEILGGMRLREDLGVGEEIEMTPLVLNKGMADGGVWGSKFFGRVMVQESHIGGGCSRKTWRAKVVYGLEPLFESGTTCVIKMCNRITYGGKGEAQLIEQNMEMERRKCRIQSLAREYCKIFSAESRVIENFGPCLEVIPVYLMYRPANTVPYATVEADLKGVYLKYCRLSGETGLVSRTRSEVEQKCCALQHWIHQWTNGNLLLTQLEGVENKLTNVGISVKTTGYQGLPAAGNPGILEQFVSEHQCNYYCGLLGLRSLKNTDSLQTPSSKSRGSKSPLLQRKAGAAGAHSPQTARRTSGSPRLPRKADDGEQEKSKAPAKPTEVTNVTNITS